MAGLQDPLTELRELNRKAGFNVWACIEVPSAESGAVVIGMPWRPEAGQYTGFLHAGVIAALIDTACGYAAATQAGLNLEIGEVGYARQWLKENGKSQAEYTQKAGEIRLQAEAEETARKQAQAASAARRQPNAINPSKPN